MNPHYFVVPNQDPNGQDLGWRWWPKVEDHKVILRSPPYTGNQDNTCPGNKSTIFFVEKNNEQFKHRTIFEPCDSAPNDIILRTIR